jgi:hypothetical protein
MASDDNAARQRLNKLWLGVPAAVVVVGALIAMMLGPPAAIPPGTGGGADPAARGVRAAYLLLDGLGYPVAMSRRLTEGRCRWLLFPRDGKRDAPYLESWVRDGGTLLLALDSPEFAEFLGLRLTVGQSGAASQTLSPEGETLDLRPGPLTVTSTERAWTTWPPDSSAPLASVHTVGRGEIWVIHRPGFLRNDRIRQGDNGLILCRLAQDMAHGQRIYFDEFFHGLRERPGVAELLFEPPALYVTLQGLLLLAVALWRFQPRFGAYHEPPPLRRRSKEEYLDALANLLEQKRAYVEAHRSVRDAFAHELEQALGMPGGTPAAALAQAAALRNPRVDLRRLGVALALELPPSAGPRDFLHAVHDLQRLRDEFFHERHHR